MLKEALNKSAQVTIFIIIAVVIIGAIAGYFLLIQPEQNVPAELEPVYNHYLSCLEHHASEGIAILGEQGGHLYADEMAFIPGSNYMPFSSQLEFLGQAIPYWLYVSGNNLLEEQVPSKQDMENELSRYIEEHADECDFDSYNNYNINLDEANVDVDIEENDVKLEINQPLSISYEEQSARIVEHSLDVDSKLGKFHNLALDVYNYEKKHRFLEDYALDVMRLYAPVTGVELTCSPKVFVKENIKQDLAEALANNMQAIKLQGNYYQLADKDSYFVQDIGKQVDENVNIMYNPDWPTNIEIYGDDVVEPVGLQEGLGILGFCYVPYHLVYDIHFPVLIQFYDNQELFQFPMAVIIEKNQKRGELTGTARSIESEICRYNNQEVSVNTYSSNLEEVDARIQFKCLNSICDIGETDAGYLEAKMPQCVNGFIIASADGYADTKYQISTNEEDTADIIMKKKYKLDVDLDNNVLIRFDSEDYSTTLFYPNMKEVELVEGYYNVTAYVYDNSSITFPAINERKCVDVPKEGIAGVFGAEEEKCFDINLPAVEVEMAVIGGGKQQEYITEGQLQNAQQLIVDIPIFGKPNSVDELQDNYLEIEEAKLSIGFE
ncbi:MAG: hypothetical protein ACP5D2_01350 [Candidatus Nanoarchaeia archaeon]